MTPLDLTMRWRKGDRLISHVTPSSAVRLESLDPEAAEKTVTVFRIPERLLRQLAQKLRRRVGFPQIPLVFTDGGSRGPLSEPWDAPQLPPATKPTRYIAALPDGGGVSGPLMVTDPVSFHLETTLAGKLKLPGIAIGALLGMPIPLTVDVQAGRKKTLEGIAYGVKDPRVELRLLTTGEEGASLGDYLSEYLSSFAAALDLSADELWSAFRDEYRDCLEEPAEIAMEGVPNSFEIDEGEAVAVDLDLYPRTPGRTLAAVGLFEAESGELLTVSDLMVLTYTEDGLLFCDS